MKTIFLLFSALYFTNLPWAQQTAGEANDVGVPNLVRDLDSTEFKSIKPGKNGFTRMYIVADPSITFISSGTKSRIELPGSVLVCMEGNVVGGKNQGMLTTYVIDKANHSKRYKIYEQDYKNNLVDGHWRAYDLGGTLKYDLQYVKDKSLGKSVYYAADGKTIQQTNNYLNDSVFVATTYYDSVKIKQVQTMLKNIPNGPSTVYYPNGQVMSTANFLKGQFNDTLKYYHDNGVLWTEEIFKKGLDWTVLNNFDNTGKPRDAGTLKNGNGTRILYTQDDKVSDTVTYIKGVGTR